MANATHNRRPHRESLSKRLGRTAKRIAARDSHVCAYCQRDAAESGAHLHLDHLTPRVDGGEDVAHNLVLACRRCNCARGAMTLAQWAAYAAVKFDLTFSARAIRGQARRSLPC